MAVDIRKKEPDMNDGYALEFDGDDDYVEISNDSNLVGMSELTLEAWFFTKEILSQHQRIVSIWEDSDEKAYQLFIWNDDYGGNVEFEIKTEDSSEYLNKDSSNSISTQEGHHLAGTYDGSEMKLYLNGELIDSKSITGDIEDVSNNLFIGIDNNNSNYFEGYIKDVRIWDIEKTQQEIQNNMTKELNGDETGLVAYYKMDEGSGDIVKDSAGNNDGTIEGASWSDRYSAGWRNGTLDNLIVVSEGLELVNNPFLKFNGDDNNVEISGSSDITGMDELTLSVWINSTGEADGNHQRIMSIWGEEVDEDAYQLFLNDSDLEASFEVKGEDGSNWFHAGDSLLNAGWKHIVGTYDGSEMIIYVDGVEKGSESVSLGSVNSSSDPMGIGSYTAQLSQMFEGEIDDVRVYDTALSASEVNDLYENSYDKTDNLVGHWKFDEGSGGTVKDSAGSNDGTINDATWVDGYISRNLDGLGTRQSPQLDLSAVGNIDSSSISWEETLNGETITIETSVDGGDTWDTCTNGDPIPNIDGASTLDIRQTLETDDTTVTPVLESLTVDIDTADSNDDSGGFSATFDEKFQVVQTDEGVFTSQEDNKLLPFVFSDSGSFYKDAENWETFIFEVVLDEDKLTSNIDFDTFSNWQRKPIKDKVWNKQDSPTSQWTKKDRPSTDWQKED